MSMPGASPRSLPRRDIILLPLVALVTILIMFVGAEASMRKLYPARELDSCIVPTKGMGLSYKPNCVSRTKVFEGPWVENKYNDCGNRSDASCGPRSAGVLRVAVMGASVAQGFYVAQADAFSQRAETELSRLCRKPVQFQNLGGYQVFWSRVLGRIPEAVDLHPDAVLMQISTFELAVSDPGTDAFNPLDQDIKAKPGAMQAHDSFLARTKNVLDRSRAMKVAQHFLLRDSSFYVPMYLSSGDKSAYMRTPLNPFWRDKLTEFDAMLGKMADAFHARGIPLVLMYTPQRAQAALAAMPRPPAGVQPWLIAGLLRDIAARHGVRFIDSTTEFLPTVAGGTLFYPVDGHVTAAGHAAIAQAVTKGLIADVPAFSKCVSDAQAGDGDQG